MKKWCAVAVCLFLFSGCGSGDGNTTIPVNGETVTGAGAGDRCGGEHGMLCEIGFACQFDEAKGDGTGVCVDSVVDKSLDCEETRQPVCGVKGRVKNGYLNTCEAERHGVEVVARGFCKKDETIVGDCSARVLAMGNCAETFTGYEFNGGKCRPFTVTACDVETPFQSLKGCIDTCQ